MLMVDFIFKGMDVTGIKSRVFYLYLRSAQIFGQDFIVHWPGQSAA
jgi:hypothetical protein